MNQAIFDQPIVRSRRNVAWSSPLGHSPLGVQAAVRVVGGLPSLCKIKAKPYAAKVDLSYSALKWSCDASIGSDRRQMPPLFKFASSRPLPLTSKTQAGKLNLLVTYSLRHGHLVMLWMQRASREAA